MVSNYDEAAQVLRVAGFHHHDSCQCGGSLQHIWKGRGIYIAVYPNKKPAMFQKRSQPKSCVTFTGDYSILEQTLNELD